MAKMSVVPTIAADRLCQGCGCAIDRGTGGQPRLYCTKACRQRYKYRVGIAKRPPSAPKPKLIYVRQCEPCGATFKQVGARQVRRCAECRDKRLAVRVDCPCGVVVWKRQEKLGTQTYCTYACWRCHAPPAVAPDESTRKGLRRARERAAPGLNQYRRGRLLAKWKRQRRTCWLCPAPADSVDHMVPLSRGGTNFEGNLAPVCRSHNSSRQSLFVMEWRCRHGWKRPRTEARRYAPTRERLPVDDEAAGRGQAGRAARMAAAA